MVVGKFDERLTNKIKIDALHWCDLTCARVMQYQNYAKK